MITHTTTQENGDTKSILNTTRKGHYSVIDLPATTRNDEEEDEDGVWLVCGHDKNKKTFISYSHRKANRSSLILPCLVTAPPKNDVGVAASS